MKDGYNYPFIAEGIHTVILPTYIKLPLEIFFLNGASGEPHIDGEPGDLILIITAQK